MRKIEAKIEALSNIARMLEVQPDDGDLFAPSWEFSEADQAKYAAAVSEITAELWSQVDKLQARLARQRARSRA